MYEMDWARDHGEYPEMDEGLQMIATGMFVAWAVVAIALLLSL